MVRSNWVTTLVVALASTGLVWGQQPIKPPAASEPPKTFKVQEMGKPARECAILKTWTTSDGAKAYQVQAMDNGEVMTIVQNLQAPPASAAPTEGKARAMATNIYHWGRNGTPPQGTPVPPQILQMGGQAPAVPLQPTPVISTPGSPVVMNDPCSSCSTCNPTQCGPCQTGPCGGSAVAEKSGPLRRMFAQKTTTQCMPGMPTQTAEPPMATADAQPRPPTSAAKAQPPSDWRQEWGKLETAKASSPAKPLPSADTKRPDPLKDADPFPRRPLDDKLGARGDAVKPPPLPTGAAQAPLTGEHLPPGTQSVVQSGTGQYLPVPMVTVPDYVHPPKVPEAKVPQAPQLNMQVNGNAFVTPAPPAPPVNTSGMAANAFTPTPEMPPAGAYPDNGIAQPSAFTPGYAVGMRPAIYRPAPGTAMANPGMMPPGAMGRGMLPATPYGPMGPGMQQPGYGMPMQPGMGQPAARAGYQTSAAGSPAGAGEMQWQQAQGADTRQLLTMLRDSFLPSQREYAAMKLAALDARSNAEAVQALVTAAREDPAATVRAGCVNALAQLKVNSAQVVAAVQALKTDGDPRVQFAAEQALAVLAPGQAAKDTAVQQTGASEPALK